MARKESTAKDVKKNENLNIDSIKKNKNIRIVDIEKEVKAESVNSKPKRYISFEQRIFIYILLILLFLTVSGLSFSLLYANSREFVVGYSETSDINYSVCLKDNGIYQNNECLGENMAYVSNIVNNINATMKYNVDFTSDISYDLGYHVVVNTEIISIYDGKVLYNGEDVIYKTDTLNDDSENININQFVTIDYNKYKEFLNNYIVNYGVTASGNIKVNLFLDEPGESRLVSTLVIPITNESFSITKENLVNELNKEVSVDYNKWTDKNITFAIIGTVSLLVLVALIYYLTNLLIKVFGRRSKYQKELIRILRGYDFIIVIARDGYNSNITRTIVKVDSFDELLDAQSTLNKPIIYSKVNDIKAEFIVEDDNTLYKYTMKDSDF